MRSGDAARIRANSGATWRCSAGSSSGPAPSASTAARMARLPESGVAIARPLARADQRAHVDQLGKERLLQRAPQVRDARRAARAGLVPDDPLDRLHVPEAPQLEAFLDVDQLLAHVVG